MLVFDEGENLGEDIKTDGKEKFNITWGVEVKGDTNEAPSFNPGDSLFVSVDVFDEMLGSQLQDLALMDIYPIVLEGLPAGTYRVVPRCTASQNGHCDNPACMSCYWAQKLGIICNV